MNNLQALYRNIHAFLLQYKRIWPMEILNYYPSGLETIPENWVAYLAQLPDETLWAFDSGKWFPNDSPLGPIIREIHQLCQIPLRKHAAPFNPRRELDSFHLGLGLKKQHEVERLLPWIKAEAAQCGPSKFVDLACGKGALGRNLGQYLNVKTFGLDIDDKLTARASKDLEKYLGPNYCGPVEFSTMDLNQIPPDDSKLGQSFLIGLHTCGPLANKHLELFLKSDAKAMMNFGCCFDKAKGPGDFNLSKLAGKNPLDYSIHSLNLATRSHTALNFEEFLIKRRVKYFRFALHLFLYHEIDIKEFQPVGPMPTRHYLNKFSSYALDRLHFIGKAQNISAKQLDDFYSSSFIQETTKKLFLANILRWQWGRLVELSIILDRALFLQDHGLSVRVDSYFDPSISPRNLGIAARK